MAGGLISKKNSPFKVSFTKSALHDTTETIPLPYWIEFHFLAGEFMSQDNVGVFALGCK